MTDQTNAAPEEFKLAYNAFARMPMPQWLTPLDGKPGHFVADPDLFYPAILEFLGLTPEMATRYDMEVALGLMKKIAMRALLGHPHMEDRRGITLLIRGDEGRKVSWRIAAFPAGDKPDISAPALTAERNAAVYKVWKKLWG